MITAIITKIALTAVVMFFIALFIDTIVYKDKPPSWVKLLGGWAILIAVTLGVLLAFIGIWS